ncbi:MAG TPA: MFS transporter [Pseudonocardia sp.]
MSGTVRGAGWHGSGKVGRDSARRGRWTALGAPLTAEAMNLLDATIVQVAGPTMHADLRGPVSDIQWFGTAYTLPFAVLLITGGRLGDILGRRRVFRIGVAGFLLGSVACALAPTAGALIAFRAVQGGAAALVVPQTIGLIRAMFAGAELPRALGCIGPVMGLAAVLGPVLGGVLTHADLFGSSWHAVFLVNVPLAAAVLAVAPAMPEDRAPHRPGLDPVGTLLAAAAVGLVVYPLVGPGAGGAARWASVASGLLVGVGFAVHQRAAAPTGRRPLVESSLFARRTFPAALVTSALFFAVSTGMTLVVVLQMRLGQGADVRTAGLTLLPWSAGMGVASWVAGRLLVPRLGHRLMYGGLGLVLAGLAGCAAVYGGLYGSTPGRPPVALLAALGLVGVGVGLFTSASFTAALAVVRPTEVGSAAGLLNAVQQTGATLGVTVLGSIYLGVSAGAGSVSPGAVTPGAVTSGAAHGAQVAVLTAAGLVVATLAGSALMREPHRGRLP